MKLTDILRQINEESSVGGGTTAGATATPGVGEQVPTTKAFKKKVKEDAPMLAAGKANIKTYTKDGFTKNPHVSNRKSKAIDYKQLYEEDLEEINENYNQFRNKTKTRSGQDQFHQAIREVKKKMAEAGKILEYAERLKNELNEGGEPLKYKRHTEGALAQIKESVVNLYRKVKSF